MDTTYDNTNRGASFPNDNKTLDTHPDYRGSINVNGTEYWLATWIKTSGPNAKKPGQQFLSHSVQEKEAAVAKTLAPIPLAAQSVTGNTGDGGFDKPEFKDVPVDDDIPF